MCCWVGSSSVLVELSQGVLHFSLEVLVVLGTLHEAVSEAGLLVRKKLVLRQTGKAVGVTLLHGGSCHLVVELVLELVGEHGQVEGTCVGRH